MSKCINCNGPSEDHNCMEYLTGRVRELEKENTWISVNDKLPKAYQDVLILTDYGKQATAYRNAESKVNYGWNDSMRPVHTYGSITHWQHLPPSNKE